MAEYIPKSPGDLITAEAWNRLQILIQEDIDSRVQKAVDEISKVPTAGDSEKLSGKTAQQLSDEILEKALQAIPKRTGYLKLFKVLRLGETSEIEHGLQACPLVDAYQIDYFPVVCAVDEDKRIQLVNFYLYHTGERRIRCQDGPNGPVVTVDIEPADGHPYKIPFSALLEAYKVEYTEESSLGDLETDFWEAFFADPNDRFDPDQYCHSPWFERCCREERTVKSLKSKGDWDELWVQVRPRKTVNFGDPTQPTPNNAPASVAPSQIQVCQYDWNTIGVRLLARPAVSLLPEGVPARLREELNEHMKDELKVMLLLKV